jgi:nitroimidazol reductase NimA-like FMN-containing flavoprotein (pyridoxamine 5'-phosphate oxidase superfamily)
MAMPQQQLPLDATIELLTQETVGHLATCDPAGPPYITPLNYLYHQGKIYFHCAKEGRKLANIAANNQVCFAVSRIDKAVFAPDACKCSTRYTSVLVFGTAGIVEDATQKAHLLNTLVAKFAAGRPFAPIDAQAASRCTVVEIAISSIHGKRNVDPEEG